MKTAKFMACVLALVMLVTLGAACTQNAAPKSSATAKTAEETKAGKMDETQENSANTEAVAQKSEPNEVTTDAAEKVNTTKQDHPFKLVYLVNGNLGDKGFYDNAASGIYRLRDELGCEVKIIEMGRDETTYEGYFLDESEKDWDLIISGTWSVKELAEEIAAKYPQKHYLFFDGIVDFDVANAKNMMGVTYQSNETAFMGGALAALMLDSGDEKVEKNKRILGFVGSMDTPNINDFLIGYIEGIKYIDPEIKLLTSYVGSFEDVPKCLEMTTQMYNQGAQIIYAPASQSILGSVQASADRNKLFIACDNDIWGMLHESDQKGVRNVVSSTMKNIGDSIFNAVQGYIKGDYVLGENYILGIKDGAVGLAENANYEKLVPQDIRSKLNDIAAKISDGSIKVGSAFGMETEKVAELRDGMKP